MAKQKRWSQLSSGELSLVTACYDKEFMGCVWFWIVAQLATIAKQPPCKQQLLAPTPDHQVSNPWQQVSTTMTWCVTCWAMSDTRFLADIWLSISIICSWTSNINYSYIDIYVWALKNLKGGRNCRVVEVGDRQPQSFWKWVLVQPQLGIQRATVARSQNCSLVWLSFSYSRPQTTRYRTHSLQFLTTLTWSVTWSAAGDTRYF